MDAYKGSKSYIEIRIFSQKVESKINDSGVGLQDVTRDNGYRGQTSARPLDVRKRRPGYRVMIYAGDIQFAELRKLCHGQAVLLWMNRALI